jgi:hypothetical protein
MATTSSVVPLNQKLANASRRQIPDISQPRKGVIHKRHSTDTTNNVSEIAEKVSKLANDEKSEQVDDDDEVEFMCETRHVPEVNKWLHTLPHIDRQHFVNIWVNTLG